MSWNEHLSKDYRGDYHCKYYKECVDCEYKGNCLAEKSIDSDTIRTVDENKKRNNNAE